MVVSFGESVVVDSAAGDKVSSICGGVPDRGTKLANLARAQITKIVTAVARSEMLIQTSIVKYEDSMKGVEFPNDGLRLHEVEYRDQSLNGT